MNELTVYDSSAAYWDLCNGDRSAEAAFYENLIQEKDHALLEMASGTGTITCRLANRIIKRHGATSRVVGIDSSSKMLDIARQRDSRIEWIQGDFRELRVQGEFDIVLCPFNTLQLVLIEKDLAQTFRSVRNILQRNGLFAFEIYQPNLEYLNSWPPARVVRSFEDSEGRLLELWESGRYDSATMILSLDWRLQDSGEANRPPVWRLPLRLRQYSATQIESLLSDAGLRIAERFGEIDRSAFTAKSKKQVVLCGIR